MPPTPYSHLRPPPYRVVDVAHNLVERDCVDQRFLVDAVVESIADLHPGDGGGQPLYERVVDSVLHEEAVRADARLA